VIGFTFDARVTELRRARLAVEDALRERGVDAGHAADVAAVVNELMGAACECGVAGELDVSIEIFALVTSVRLRCDERIELRDKPFDVRERLIQRIAVAFGRRRRSDGSFDVWAEIARPTPVPADPGFPR
jgi:hypothetical protein